MTIDDFFKQWDGKVLDADGAYGGQCVDVFKQYNKDVVGSQAVLHGNAVDYWTNVPQGYDKVANTPANFPAKGDVVIWGTQVGQYGHIAIARDFSGVLNLYTFDQNWPIGSSCHNQKHNYKGVVGWLRPSTKPLTNML